MTSLLAPVTVQTDANLLHRMMQCLATKIKIICTNESKILSLVYTTAVPHSADYDIAALSSQVDPMSAATWKHRLLPAVGETRYKLLRII